MPGIVAFTKVAGPGGWLGNMAPYPVTYNGWLARTNEHLFQALRFGNDLDNEYAAKILEQKSPMGAKFAAKAAIKAGHAVIGFRSEQDLENMEFCVYLKLSQHSKISTLLDQTGDDLLIEDTTSRGRPDLFWGAARVARDDPGVVSFVAPDGSCWRGENRLGKIWMSRRSSQRFI